MKYIVTENEEGEREIFVFPRSVQHVAMAEAVSAMKNQMHGDWKRIRRNPVSAGFVEGGQCSGHSESLHLGSQSADSDLLPPPVSPNWHWIKSAITAGGAIRLKSPMPGKTFFRARMDWPGENSVTGEITMDPFRAMESLDKALMEDAAAEMQRNGDV